jgi:hypothetical protein
MNQKNYTATFYVSQTPEEVFKCVNNLSKWWTENIEGSSENINDIFTLDWGGGNFVTQKLTEVIPNEKIVWLVTDCYLSWLNDKTEWKNTSMVFEISLSDNKTKLNFTHIGLIPEVECYDMCVKGWDQYFKGSLHNLITTGEGQPQKKVI